MKILYAIITILIIFLIYSKMQYNNIYNNIYEGLWMASDEFCKLSQIDGMLLYIGPLEKGNRLSYLIMYVNNNVVFNKKINIYCQMSIKPSKFTINISTDDDSNIEDVMPAKQHVIVDVSKSKMIWTADDGTTYAELYKNNMI